MGGLRRFIPWTFWTFAIGTAAIAGVPFLSGFFSKDAILAGALEAHRPLLFAVAQEALVIAAPLRELAAVQLGDTRGHVLQETPVVGDEDERPGELPELLFQPADGGDVQVVGGLVQQ